MLFMSVKSSCPRSLSQYLQKVVASTEFPVCVCTEETKIICSVASLKLSFSYELRSTYQINKRIKIMYLSLSGFYSCKVVFFFFFSVLYTRAAFLFEYRILNECSYVKIFLIFPLLYTDDMI